MCDQLLLFYCTLLLCRRNVTDGIGEFNPIIYSCQTNRARQVKNQSTADWVQVFNLTYAYPLTSQGSRPERRLSHMDFTYVQYSYFCRGAVYVPMYDKINLRQRGTIMAVEEL